ncbi:sulfite exporter TauE/SafE family protein [uncultured Shimia sp.]|uniref:sulfite exporter TauE/SafE family protein n=1 Tax=uncultured Shimia sp. TaxID=573152 RepID=UPI00260C27D8|nr:sulfite exporter TauE/SafE family protein [uncultured Shimia sp.]
MPDILAEVLALEGLAWIIGATFLAGLVRGFSGFGTALIYVPIAAQYLSPIWVIITIALMDVAGPAPNLPKVWKDRTSGDLVRMFVGVLVGLPIGLALLTMVDPNVFRYTVSILALLLLVLLLSGFRYRGAVRPSMLYGIGGASGFLGGVAGIPGPPMIMFYMTSTLPVAVIRANATLFLVGYDVILVAMVAVQGLLNGVPLVLGLFLTLPNMLGNYVGGLIFNPDYQRVYRAVAYLLVAATAISSLPFWS